MKTVKTAYSFSLLLICIGFIIVSCKYEGEKAVPPTDTPYLVVLGTSQDGGYPQAGCTRECCKIAWEYPELRRLVSCIAIVDPVDGKQWIIDATPDFKEQLHKLGDITGNYGGNSISGIILTHAHAGHYTGLIHLGREIMGTDSIPVHAMPRMRNFLQRNGPWDQLVSLKNIQINPMKSDSTFQLNERISITPLLVPHRDEYTETAGIVVESNNRKALFIPDIDKWNDWDVDICTLVHEVDVAFLDATFYGNDEIPGRDMIDIPHPFIMESFARFEKLSASDKAKIHFIHFNHSNPVLIEGSNAMKEVYQKGYSIAQEGQIVKL